MNTFPDIQSYWDLTQQPETFSALPDDDFLAFLQKQFPTSVGTTPNSFDTSADGVDPQTLTRFPSNATPSSSDSSPSPPSLPNDAPSSRRQSEGFSGSPNSNDQEDATLKRKASDESITDEPTHKSQHTNSDEPGGSRKAGGSNRRKSTGAQDESRLLKRKEQNRAAQRAFRERKEKHVKDLEDKVAALEAKNVAAENENENLRDLLSRLQNENMILKQTAFTFSMPRSNSGNAPVQQTGFNFPSPGAGPSKSAVSPVAQHTPQSTFESTFGSLISFDPNMMMNDEPTATDNAMNMEFGFPVLNDTPRYKTIASNPNYMSFAEPSPFDSPHTQSNGNGNGSNESSPNYFTPIDMNSLESWSPDLNHSNNMDTSLDQLFGGNYIGANPGTVDFTALLMSSPHPSLSPVSHASITSSSSPSSSGSTTTPSSIIDANANSNGAANGASGSDKRNNSDGCPRTKEELSKMIEKSGPSAFVEENACAAPITPFLRKATEAGSGPIVMCKGSSFPKTEKSDKNVEVLAAWRSITSNPQFKDFDINELCSEFTSKARCDGTKVVLEPQGVHHIIETLAAKRQQQASQ